MKFSISRERLLQPLQSISGAVEKRQTLPILSHIFVNVSDTNDLTIIGTDLEVEIKITLPLDQPSTPGTTTFPARKFFDLSKAISEESDINIQVSKNRATVRSMKSRFTLSTLPSDEFPRVDKIKEVAQVDELTQSLFKNLLQKTQFSMAMQDVRYYLNGLMLELEGNKICFVATLAPRFRKSR